MPILMLHDQKFQLFSTTLILTFVLPYLSNASYKQHFGYTAAYLLYLFDLSYYTNNYYTSIQECLLKIVF